MKYTPLKLCKLFAAILFGIFLTYLLMKEHHKEKMDMKKEEIIPMAFGTGYIMDPKHDSSNQCAGMLKYKSMYPIQPPYVNYGEFNCTNSDVVTFNSPP